MELVTDLRGAAAPRLVDLDGVLQEIEDARLEDSARRSRLQGVR